MFSEIRLAVAKMQNCRWSGKHFYFEVVLSRICQKGAYWKSSKILLRFIFKFFKNYYSIFFLLFSSAVVSHYYSCAQTYRFFICISLHCSIILWFFIIPFYIFGSIVYANMSEITSTLKERAWHVLQNVLHNAQSLGVVTARI